MDDMLLFGGFAVLLLGILLLLLWRRKRARKPEAVIDGSNVMHWQDNTAKLAPVKQVLRQLQERGYRAGVIFDANAGYKLFGRHADDRHLGRALGIGAGRVMVVPKGVQADPYLLTYARDTGAIVISNDRFRDRIAEFPQMGAPGRLVKGGWRDGKVWLDLPERKRA
ncbi:NYN domain-containing protein [Tabrizicola aquatica]|uniref:NYN domain-containing protein n=1 Tax=Tabrizicola aquatica TaxID=909926 RepID=UPI000CD11FE7|nr:hypothetical protein [Tabrizicola aquatica]